IAEEAVAQFLIAALAVLFRDFIGAEHAAQAVAPATGVSGNRCQYTAHVRIQAVTAGELGGVLTFEAVGQVQALGFFVSIEHR
nr:hypothetical protein [Tanacetum cinerariifolium]